MSQRNYHYVTNFFFVKYIFLYQGKKKNILYGTINILNCVRNLVNYAKKIIKYKLQGKKIQMVKYLKKIILYFNMRQFILQSTLTITF